MGYLHVDNLYKNQEILTFKECYAMEKIHGTSAHISFKRIPLLYPDVVENLKKTDPEFALLTLEQIQEKWPDKIEIGFFAGGASHEQFVKLFDKKQLEDNFRKINQSFAIVYGEAYGGKMQGMSGSYGPVLKFVAFDYFAGKSHEDAWWYSVTAAEHFVKELGLEFVDYVKIPATVEALNAERDKDSTQAIRNGMGPGHMREGIVCRPLFEYRKSKEGGRIISKHKRDEFKETKTPREVIVDPTYLKVIEDAKLIAEEWVTPMRLQHVLDKFPNANIEQTREIINAMVEDVEREGVGEITIGSETRASISRKTAGMFKQLLKDKLLNNN